MPEGPGQAGVGALTWWDHFNPLKDLQEKTFAQFTKDTGVRVDYTVQATSKMGQRCNWPSRATSCSMHTNVGLEILLPALIEDGWYQPLQLSAEAEKLIPEDGRLEGIHTFDGKQ